ncbi:hypothetical protein [Haloferula sp.]|uniref:hypothetical protein n=1 Tax=Haloferula sp. TaxID=2497595 RepID=UPI00329C8C45
MKRTTRQVLRVILFMIVVSFALLFPESESPLIWIPVFPWAILCIVGIVCTLPLIVVLFGLAGGAQADWMSDTMAAFVFIVIPTAISVSASELFHTYRQRKSKQAGHGDGG